MVLIQHTENGLGRFLSFSLLLEENKARFVVLPEGATGYGWENMITALSNLLGEMGISLGVGLVRGVGVLGGREEYPGIVEAPPRDPP